MKPKKPLVSVVIVNFNGKDFISDCLDSLKKSGYKNLETIIVDNGSTDGSLELIEKLAKARKNFKLIKNSKNLGFAEPNNQGAKIARGEFILLLNNDTIITPKMIEILVKAIKGDNRLGVVQPKIIFHQTKRLQAGGAFLTPFGFLYYFGYRQDPNQKKYNRRRPIFSANGASMLVRKSLVDKIGLFDKDFFAYYEETDFCHRVWLAGYRVIYEPEAVVFHKGGLTSEKKSRGFIYFHSFKNRFNSTLKNFEAKSLLTLLPLMFSIYIFLTFYFLIKARVDLSRAIAKAIFWNVLCLSDTIRKRKKVQKKIRQVLDNQYLPETRWPVTFRYYFRLLGYEDEGLLFEKKKKR